VAAPVAARVRSDDDILDDVRDDGAAADADDTGADEADGLASSDGTTL
jgi:hypothetical protein